ncbi:Hypothetical predicted protein [Octopus vulgaris]|uniref:Uncharacterized protein n=1 Tax=Octopus vulgaris TaxID=6645 RepID=A0AA36AZT1_OCTVU|nr:Hypothetical predicted protein [Octopus vulgaris]
MFTALTAMKADPPMLFAYLRKDCEPIGSQTRKYSERDQFSGESQVGEITCASDNMSIDISFHIRIQSLTSGAVSFQYCRIRFEASSVIALPRGHCQHIVLEHELIKPSSEKPTNYLSTQPL